ncbi:MAG TPA: hypothetical protein VF851_00330 [Steroidobacteraceae bacterium]
MTQAELWQLQLMAVANTANSFESILTVVFAYLAAAYFVGHRLSRFQVATLSVLYVLGATGGVFFTVVEFRRAAYFVDLLVRNYGEQHYSPNVYLIPLFALTMALLIVASLLFMVQIRRRGGTDTSQPAVKSISQ